MKKLLLTSFLGLFVAISGFMQNTNPYFEKAAITKPVFIPQTTILDKDGGLSEKMLAPQRASTATGLSRAKAQIDLDTLHITPDMYLLSNDDEMTSSVLEVKVNATQWANLTNSNTWYAELNTISENIYAKCNDDFDFVFFVLNTPQDQSILSNLAFYGINISISNDIQGIGLPTYSNSEYYGSGGKLKSVMYFPYADAILAGPALHELAHNWGAFILDRYLPDNLLIDDVPGYAGHWGVSNAGGQLGGFNHIRVVQENCDGIPGKTLYQASLYPETNPDGSFQYPGFGTYANGGNGLSYSDIELYLMGMKSAQELRDSGFHLDIYSGNSYNIYEVTFNEGYFYSTTKTSYTIDDIIAQCGERVPDASASQKQFKVLTVALTPENAAQSAVTDIMQSVGWFAGSMDDTSYYPWLYNFRQATNNVGSLLTNDIKGSFKNADAPVLSNIVTNKGTLAPAFHPYIFEYTVYVDSSVESIDITGISDNPNITVTGNVTALPLALNDCTDIKITITDENNKSRTYSISVIRGKLPPASFTWIVDDTERTKKISIGINTSCTIDWGDGTPIETITLESTEDIGLSFITDIIILNNIADLTHTYNNVGEYTVTISGTDELNCPLTSLIIGDLLHPRSGRVEYDQKVTAVNVKKADKLTFLQCSVNQITALDISRNTLLQWLYCSFNQLTSLDVTNNIALRVLLCDYNQIDELDISRLTALEHLECMENQISLLNANSPNMYYLHCMRNQLTSLDISECKKLIYLYCDDNQLTNLDISECTKLTLLGCSSNQLTNLNISKCTKLTELGCAQNQLTNLDISENPELVSLGCYENYLTNLDISGCTKLIGLNCSNNYLTNLDISVCPNLMWLQCQSNQLPKLDVSGCKELTELRCSINLLSSLDISGCKELTRLICDYNQLTSLDVSGCTKLTELICHNNQLSNLDISGCAKLEYLEARNQAIIATKLDGVYINPITYTLPNGSKQEIKINGTEVATGAILPNPTSGNTLTFTTDYIPTYITSQSFGGKITLIDPDGIDETGNVDIKIYPVVEGMYIIGAPQGETIHIYNASGSKARELTAQSDKIFVPLPQVGVYIVNVAGKSVKVVK